MVFLEAMAMKRPVIAIVSGGVPEFVDHGKAGLLSVHKDIDSLAANILTLVNDPELRQRMGEYGRKQVEQQYHPAKMTREMEQVYHRVVASRKGRREQLAALAASTPTERVAPEETLA